MLNKVNFFVPNHRLIIFGRQSCYFMCQPIMLLLRSLQFIFLVISVLHFMGRGAQAQSKTLNGVTIDGQTGLPLPYVSIGIKNKPIGTVSDSIGQYSLSHAGTDIDNKDSIFFSAVGYRSVKMDWNSFIAKEKIVKFYQSPQMLEVVNVKAKPGQIKTYGRSNASIIFFPAMYKSIPKYSDEKGREQATILKIDQDVFLRRLSFKINRRTFRKIKFRMNIYSVKAGLPDQSILHKDVVFDVNGTTETRAPRSESIDLRPYHIHIKGQKEIAVSLAILNLEPLPGDSTQATFFIPSFPGPLRSSLYRIKAEAPWQKVSKSYLLVELEASSIKNSKDDTPGNLPDTDAEIIGNTPSLKGLLYGNNQGKRIRVDEGEIYYESYGKGSPLFLLHGNNERINSFREQIEPLSRHFKVIALDTRGQGNSTNNSASPYTYEQFAQDLSVVMDSLSIKKASLLGWSDGGNTALIFALNHPENVEKMVLMGANLFPGPEAIEEDVIEDFKNRRDSLMKLPDPESQNQMRLADLVLKEPHIDDTALQRIAAPVLVVAGEFDVVKKQHTMLIHSLIKNSRLEIIPGGDHYAPLKDPKVFNKIVLDCLVPGNSLE
ncbi:alpha/beta fold hydrolase [Arcticibacter tournemirensis]|uniref:Alpha/beta fold hydrolase n=2 Tax=Arcticibacter tournemirensis TaxID=699437 RepID=A0A5M9HCG3_9SPHI|nr:alpha/beta fold hydrolase [Arcticibacter tournemirensis]